MNSTSHLAFGPQRQPAETAPGPAFWLLAICGVGVAGLRAAAPAILSLGAGHVCGAHLGPQALSLVPEDSAPQSVSTPEVCHAPPQQLWAGGITRGPRHSVGTGFERWTEHTPFG